MDPASFDPNPTLGAVQIGVLVAYVLFGVATTQAYIYFSRFPDDSRRVKAFIVLVWSLDIAHSLCFGHVLYTFTILDFAQPQRLGAQPPKSLSVSTLFSGLTAAAVQGFYSYRIYLFTKKLFVPCILWFMALLHFAGRVLLFATTLHTPSILVYIQQWEWLITTNWGLSVATDVAISVTMVTVLYRRRSNAHRKTAALVDKLIVWTIETGLLTSATSLVMLGSFLKSKENFTWLAFHAIGTQLFTNSLIASMNSRASLRSRDPIALSSLSSNRPVPPGVHIQTVKHVTYEGEEVPPQKIPEDV
ncbi:hypothetical protein MSAN_01814500 [Mycena sanguinolenta]|uniref:DUF6534 domain-containing protein n=1 Tax=Mycena sanguinolenta TaxID=230812 RepID=A0A8H6XUX9_9AGAR|nr:hypothetical protein MSAN_01814500 [Mycena sanguinolenta]